jgi:endonuclease YncB( thermonuclease family)
MFCGVSFLRLLCLDSTKKISMEEKRVFSFFARCTKVYDGDTITVARVLDGNLFTRRCRIRHIDAPELRGVQDKTPAIASRDFLQTLVPTGLFRVSSYGMDKYGRLLIDFHVRGGGDLVSQAMIASGHAVPYDGKTKSTQA